MEGIGVRLQTSVFSGSEQWYLLRLRVLGAWWCLGSSVLKPYLLLTTMFGGESRRDRGDEV